MPVLQAFPLMLALLASAEMARAQVWTPGRPGTPPRATRPSEAPAPTRPPAQGPSGRDGRGSEHHLNSGYGYSLATLPPEVPGCSIVLSGALNGVYGCNLVQGSWRSSYDEGQVNVLFNVGYGYANAPVIEVRLAFRGAPSVGMLTTQAQAVRGSAIRVRWGNQVWSADEASGGFTLRLARVTRSASTVDGLVYTVAGRLDAELPAVWGEANGVVRARVVFD